MIKYNIQKFTLLVLFILITVFFSLFSYYHFDQQNKTAAVILKSINSQLSETSYVLSKNVNSKESTKSFRPILDRIAANNEFIQSILIHDEQNILVSTDPFSKKIISTNSMYNHEVTEYDQLMEAEALETTIRYYKGNKVQKLKLLFMLDKKEIAKYFNEKKSNFLLYFGLIPLIVLIAMWSLIQHLVVKPLEQLRQFAYYQNTIPKAFFLRELEVIRYSMVQTFDRLDNEKKELYSIARTDTLSGLANRNALNEFLERLISNSFRQNKEFAFLFLDLDHFKTINDSLGHNVGDELLKKVASIIDEVLRPNDFVARVGGDEFVIIVQDYNSLMELTNVIQRVQKHLSETWIIQTNPISISSSVGVAFYPKDGDDIVSLMKHSDIAMYEAKKEGRARYHFFTEDLNKRVQDTISLDKEMRDALENNHYELYYQPKIDIKSGKIVSAEALIRWISPTKGIIPPDEFIPLAEENAFIIELGEWVVEEAIKQQMLLKQKGIDIIISINISTKHILADGFYDYFVNTLKRYKVNPRKIDIEITEYIFLQKDHKNTQVLKKLHDYGVKISLDDFGTGYSSLSYLKMYSIDHLKIDKNFMDDYNTYQGAIFIDTIVKMGQTLNMTIIAEGVEEKEQVDYLNSIGCNQYQGYHYSRPITVTKFEELYLESNTAS